MPHVMVDFTKLNDLHCGLGQLCLHLGQALAEAGKDRLRMTLLTRGSEEHLLAGRGAETFALRPWRKEKFIRWLRPVLRWPFRGQCDLWHATDQFCKYWPIDPRIPVVLTIHDLAFLTEKQGCSRKIAKYTRRLQRKVDRAALIVTGSHYSADEIREHLDPRGKEIRVIPHGATFDPSGAMERPPLVRDGPFLFFIGKIMRRKNIHVLPGLLSGLDGMRLVIAGDDTHPYANEARRAAEQHGVEDRVLFLGRVSDAERRWLYANCEAFCFPSLHEGFGLPVLEAMAHGRPVFVSDRTSLPEVAGDLGFTFTEFEPNAMVTAYRNGMAEFASRPDMPRQLRARAAEFTWRRAAETHLALYEQVCDTANS